jgi:DNA-binding response OmpR family regulator
MRVLVVDDDPAFRRYTGIALEERGIEYRAVVSADAALVELEATDATPFDLILLDMEMPGLKGTELLEILRRRGLEIPVLFTTVHDALSEKVRALELGADDYLVKPFEFEELYARMQSVLRRERRAHVLTAGSLRLDLDQRHLHVNDRPIDITPVEFGLLLCLLRGRERAVSRKEILREVWGSAFDPGTNIIDVHMSRLRRKLSYDAEMPVEIETLRGIGYRLRLAPGPGDGSRSGAARSAGELEA